MSSLSIRILPFLAVYRTMIRRGAQIAGRQTVKSKNTYHEKLRSLNTKCVLYCYTHYDEDCDLTANAKFIALQIDNEE